jgi:hypothetical protein
MTNELKGNIPRPPLPPQQKKPRNRVEAEEPTSTEQSVRWVQVRLIPIWLRIILVVLLFLGVAAIGIIVGYSFIGDGDSGDALKWSTWQHLLDIMNGKEN